VGVLRLGVVGAFAALLSTVACGSHATGGELSRFGGVGLADA
jgi:hypothetical protein